MSKAKAKKKPAAKKGRPVEPVPQDFAEEIVAWIADGKTLREYCRQPGKPAWRTVYQWREKDAHFDARIAHARVTGFDAIAEEALEIANTPMEGEITTVGPEGRTVRREDMLGHRKLQIETRLKLLAKWDPKRYGDKLELGGQLAVTPVLNVIRSGQKADSA